MAKFDEFWYLILDDDSPSILSLLYKAAMSDDYRLCLLGCRYEVEVLSL